MAVAGRSGTRPRPEPIHPPTAPRGPPARVGRAGPPPGPKPRWPGVRTSPPGTCQSPAQSAAGGGRARCEHSRVPAGLTWLCGRRADPEQQDQGGEQVQEAPPPRSQPGPPAGTGHRLGYRARPRPPPVSPRCPRPSPAPRGPHLGAMLGGPDRLCRGMLRLRRGAPAPPAAL